MQQRYESINAVAARCVDTSARLREFLFSGEELAWTVRRDIATAANLLVALGLELDESYQGIVDTAELITPPRTAHAGLNIAREASCHVMEETRLGLSIPVP
jgi:hypothetical protein